MTSITSIASSFPLPDHEIKIAGFDHWNLYLHADQSYLGRCYLWAVRPDAIDFVDMSDEEWQEFRLISQNLRKTLIALFAPDLFNYAALGNITRHLHFHFIPRYATARAFKGIQFMDCEWGSHYSPQDKKILLPLTVRQAIADRIAEKIKLILQ